MSEAHPGPDTDAWLRLPGRPEVRIVTLTVTEAGYVRGARRRTRRRTARHPRDLAALRRDRRASVRTAPARLVAGLAARRAAGAGPLAVVSCDNLPENGARHRPGGRPTSPRLLDADLAGWIGDNVSFVTTMVDRITPAHRGGRRDAVAELTGRADAAPVVTEPFTEWVLSGEFPGGRPAWEDAGARFVDDITPFEERKLWLLNGAHSLLAYAGSARGHQTIAEAVADPVCLDWMDAVVGRGVAAPHAARRRRSRPIGTRCWSGSPTRGSGICSRRSPPTDPRSCRSGSCRRVRLERAEGRLPVGALRVVAAWINHLRGAGAPVKDAAADQVVALARRTVRLMPSGDSRLPGPRAGRGRCRCRGGRRAERGTHSG